MALLQVLRWSTRHGKHLPDGKVASSPSSPKSWMNTGAPVPATGQWPASPPGHTHRSGEPGLGGDGTGAGGGQGPAGPETVIVFMNMYESGTLTAPFTDNGSVAPGPFDHSSVKVTSPYVPGPAVHVTLEWPRNCPSAVFEKTPEAQPAVSSRSADKWLKVPWSPTRVHAERLWMAKKTPLGADSFTYFVPFACTVTSISAPIV
mmetsp:Transcript_81834/g.226754  ORF Transcript_81834/g.226754 Transcript_81834/m.226754 type:complete len:204 (-) Transcript_81834:223-834(-)